MLIGLEYLASDLKHFIVKVETKNKDFINCFSLQKKKPTNKQSLSFLSEMTFKCSSDGFDKHKKHFKSCLLCAPNNVIVGVSVLNCLYMILSWQSRTGTLIN